MLSPAIDSRAAAAALGSGIAGRGFVGDRVFVRALAWDEVPTSDVEFQFRLDETRARRAAIVERAQRISHALAALVPPNTESGRRRSRASSAAAPPPLTLCGPPRRVWSARTLKVPLPCSPRYPGYDPIRVSSAPRQQAGTARCTTVVTPRGGYGRDAPAQTATAAAPPELRDAVECRERFDSRRAALRSRTARALARLETEAALLSAGRRMTGSCWELRLGSLADCESDGGGGTWVQTVLHLLDGGDLICEPADDGPMVVAGNLARDCVRFSAETFSGFDGGGFRIVMRAVRSDTVGLRRKESSHRAVAGGRRDLCLAWRAGDSPPCEQWEAEIRRVVRPPPAALAACSEELEALEQEAEDAARERRRLAAVLRVQRWVRHVKARRAEREERLRQRLEVVRLAYVLRGGMA